MTFDLLEIRVLPLIYSNHLQAVFEFASPLTPNNPRKQACGVAIPC